MSIDCLSNAIFEGDFAFSGIEVSVRIKITEVLGNTIKTLNESFTDGFNSR